MPYFNFKNIKISAVSAAVPTKIVKIEDFVKSFGQAKIDKFKESTGIQQFRKTKKHQTASDLCFAAAESIFVNKKINKDEIGALVFVSHSLDYRRPATACVLHKRLGLSKDCAAFDISLGCSAFVYGVQVICSLMQSSSIDKALLLVGETVTKMVHPQDQSVAMLFGDGGSAILLEKTTDGSEINGVLKTDGEGYRAIIAPAGGFRNLDATKKEFLWSDGNTRNLYNTIMNGEDVFSFTISAVPRTIKEFLEREGKIADDYDCLAFHQANQFISKILAKKLKIGMDKMPLCLNKYGNPSAPAIPMVICDTYGQNDEHKDLSFLMCGFGVGLSWGVCSAIINTADILPIIETDEVFIEGIINSPEDF